MIVKLKQECSWCVFFVGRTRVIGRMVHKKRDELNVFGIVVTRCRYSMYGTLVWALSFLSLF